MEKSDKQVNEVIKLLLSTENNISNRINDVVLDLLRLGYGDNSERGKRGKEQVKNLRKSVDYIFEELEDTLNL